MDFLGRGWAFPPVFDKETLSVNMVAGVEDIRQSLNIILSTSLGERIMRPDFGCNLKDYQFEPLNSNLVGFIRDTVLNALIYHEPRIRVDNIDVNADDQIEGRLMIVVDYRVRSTNSRFNFVYDFYVKGESAIGE
jgi:uncharacterized protein